MSEAKNNQEPANNDNEVLANVLLSVDDFRFDRGNSDHKASIHTGKSMYSAQETERLMKEYADHVYKHKVEYVSNWLMLNTKLSVEQIVDLKMEMLKYPIWYISNVC